MFETRTERGQVGIGTLIVFIAMVLVAAIAAGVLVNTAGFLQEKAQQTGEKATSEVSDGVQAISAVGIVESSSAGSDAIRTIKIRVKKRPGSDAVALGDTVIQYVEGTNKFEVTGDSLSNVNTDNRTTTILDSTSTTETITLSLVDESTNKLDPGDEATITIITPAGAKTTVAVRAPSTLGGEQSCAAVQV